MTFCGRNTYTSMSERCHTKYVIPSMSYQVCHTSTYRRVTQQHSHVLQSKQLQNPPLFQVKYTICKSQSSLKGPLYPGHGRTWDCLCSLSTPEVSPKLNGCINETIPLTSPPPQSILSGQPNNCTLDLYECRGEKWKPSVLSM